MTRHPGRDPVSGADVAELRRALEAATELVREVRHRLRNHLQLVASLLALQADATRSAAARAELEQAGARVRAIALAQERGQPARGAAEVDLAIYLRALVESVSSMEEREELRFEVSAEPIRLPLDRAVPVGLAVNELLTNALKHAFPDRVEGVVRVAARQDNDGAIEITVADSGVGLPEAIDLDRPRSLGLRLLKRLSAQARARVELDRTGGTRFRLVLEQTGSEAANSSPGRRSS